MTRKTYRENWVTETAEDMRESGQYTEEFVNDWVYLWQEMGIDLRDLPDGTDVEALVAAYYDDDLEGMFAATGGE